METRGTLKNNSVGEIGNRIMIMVLMIYNTIVVLWPIFFRNAESIKKYNVYVSLGITLISFVFCFFRYGYKIRMKAFTFPMIFAMWFALSALINNSTDEVLKNPVYWIFTQCLPVYILSFDIYDYKKIFNMMVRVSYVVICLYFVAYIFDSVFKMELGYMVISYALLPFVLFVIQDAFYKPKLKNIAFSIAGVLLIFLKGGRGVLVCALVLVAINMVIDIHKKRKGYVFVALLFAAVLFLQSSAYMNMLNSLNTFLKENDIKSRNITTLIEGEFADDNGRSTYHAATIIAIKRSPIYGYGLCGDRAVLSEIMHREASYPHNIILEWMAQMGIGGGLLLAWVIYKIARIMFSTKNIHFKMWIMVLIPLTFVKLMLSSTYIAEVPFFMMLAVALSVDEEKLEEIDREYLEESNNA